MYSFQGTNNKLAEIKFVFPKFTQKDTVKKYFSKLKPNCSSQNTNDTRVHYETPPVTCLKCTTTSAAMADCLGEPTEQWIPLI